MPARFPEWDLQQKSPVQKLFQTINDKQSSVVGKGSIIAFNYVGQTGHKIHDPTPLVIVTDIFTNMIRGLNLHYLDLPYVKNIVLNYANNTGFSFRFISGDAYIVGAFRSYKRNGISQLRMLDVNFLKNLLTVVRALDPGEIDRMREQIHHMMGQQTQPVAQAGVENQ